MFVTRDIRVETPDQNLKVDTAPFKELDRPWTMSKAWSYTMSKAGCKHVDGQVVKLTWSAKFKRWIEGGSGVRRHHKAAYESRHLEALAGLRVQHELTAVNPLAKQDEIDKAIANNHAVKNYRSRVDRRRFSEAFKADSGATRRTRCARFLSRVGFQTAGFGEITVAPTSLVLGLATKAFWPKLSDRGGGFFARSFAALHVAGLCVFIGVFTAGKALSAMGVSAALRNLLANYSFFTLACYSGSMVAETAAQLVDDQAPLNTRDTAILKSNIDLMVNRTADMILRSANEPVLRQVLGMALGNKVSSKYCTPVEGAAYAEPKLLTFLYNNISSKTGVEDARSIVREVFGRYLSQASLLDDGVELDLSAKFNPDDRVKDSVNTRSRMTREKHIAALVALMDNYTVHAEQEPSGWSGITQDARPILQCWITKGMDKLSYSLGVKSASLGVDSDGNAICTRRDELEERKKQHGEIVVKGHHDHILTNHHQYGRFTVALARIAEGVRVFNYSGVLSTNMQLARPSAWLAGKIRENLPGHLKGHQSRVVSWASGRIVSSAVWAVLEALFILPAASGNPAANVTNMPHTVDPNSAVSFPIGIQTGLPFALSVISTGAHMILVGAIQAPFMLATKLAYQIEGWHGPTTRTFDAHRVLGRVSV